MYGTSRGEGALNALQYAAVSAAGIYGGVPVTAAMVAKHGCLATLPVLLTVPSASTFADDLAVYTSTSTSFWTTSRGVRSPAPTPHAPYTACSSWWRCVRGMLIGACDPML